MAIHRPFGFLLFSLLLSSTFSESTSFEINSWCSKTPYPETCQYFINQKFSDVKQEKYFAKLIVQMALDQALHARTFTLRRMGYRIKNESKKVALQDCSELFEHTVYRLNQTINGGKCTDFDRQTWLTAAKTNIATCKTGFFELGLGLSNNILFPISNNVSELISIALAMNKDVLKYYKNGFPSWISRDDKTILMDYQDLIPSLFANVVVAKDGSGNFTTIKKAIRAASKSKGYDRFVIYVKEGTYKEHILIQRKVRNITLVGDGIGKTIITENKHVGGKFSTYNSSTLAVIGDGFFARDITFQNTAGPSKGQAVALRSNSDLSVFYRCSFEGYQDTLYVHSGRQFYRECDIYGTIDFIFGNAVVVFQKCNIYGRKPQGKDITITASKRSDPYGNSGIIVLDSNVLATEELKSVESSVRTYLGRPWGEYARTVFLNTNLDMLINPAGWLEWNSDPDNEDLYYGEYNNTGRGSSTSMRVNWKGYHDITDESEASNFTVANFLLGDSWLPATCVPYTSGLRFFLKKLRKCLKYQPS